MPDLKITMLGPRAVGKTTLLTAMYDRFEGTIGRTNLQLTPDDLSAALLAEKLDQLKRLLVNPKVAGGIDATPKLEDPAQLPVFKFGLGKKASSPSLNLHFHDYPGGYMEATSAPTQREYVSALLRESHVVVIAIDAPPLMEKNGYYNERFNRPSQIKAMFAGAYQNLDSRRLVLFAPVKCEKYMVTPEGTQNLTRRIKESYATTLDFFRNEKIQPHVAAVITPVQTVGGVVFSQLQEIADADPHFMYRKTGFNAQYIPRDSEQPLRYLLSFLLKLHYDNRSTGFWGWLRWAFGLDEHLLTAAREFAKECKRSDGFEVVQGSELLLSSTGG
jgi:hypothetical protein